MAIGSRVGGLTVDHSPMLKAIRDSLVPDTGNVPVKRMAIPVEGLGDIEPPAAFSK